MHNTWFKRCLRTPFILARCVLPQTLLSCQFSSPVIAKYFVQNQQDCATSIALFAVLPPCQLRLSPTHIQKMVGICIQGARSDDGTNWRITQLDLVAGVEVRKGFPLQVLDSAVWVCSIDTDDKIIAIIFGPSDDIAYPGRHVKYVVKNKLCMVAAPAAVWSLLRGEDYGANTKDWYLLIAVQAADK